MHRSAPLAAPCRNTLPSLSTAVVHRRPARLGILLALLMLGVAASVPSAEAPVFKSSTVRSARSTLDAALAAARKDFDQKYLAAQKKYLDVLEAAVKQATKDGDLQEANKLNLELRAVATAPYAGGVPALTGAWRMRWGDQGSTNYTFTDDGNVSRELRDAPTQGVLRRSGDDLVIDFGDQSLMRVNLAGQRLFLEYWGKQTDAPQRFPNQIGVGEKVAR